MHMLLKSVFLTTLFASTLGSLHPVAANTDGELQDQYRYSQTFDVCNSTDYEEIEVAVAFSKEYRPTSNNKQVSFDIKGPIRISKIFCEPVEFEIRASSFGRFAPRNFAFVHTRVRSIDGAGFIPRQDPRDAGRPWKELPLLSAAENGAQQRPADLQRFAPDTPLVTYVMYKINYQNRVYID